MNDDEGCHSFDRRPREEHLIGHYWGRVEEDLKWNEESPISVVVKVKIFGEIKILVDKASACHIAHCAPRSVEEWKKHCKELKKISLDSSNTKN